MKFNQVNDMQIQQANEAVAVISKLRKILAKEKLGRNFLKFQCNNSVG
jgi:hypothetical protein